MTYSSSGPSLAQALDMNMDQQQHHHQDPSRKSDIDVDLLPSNLAPSKSSSLPTSDLSDLHDSRSNNPRSLSHPHYIRSNEIKVENDFTRNHLHHAHLQLRQIEYFDDKTVDEPAQQSHLQLHKTSHHSHSHSHHSHQRLHRSKSPANLHLRAAQPRNVHANANVLKPRAEQDFVTQVVQTVSVVQIVDSAGSPVKVQTHYAEPATVVVDSASGITIAAISNPEPKLSVAAVAPVPAASYDVPSPPPAAAPTAVETPGLTDPSPSVPIPVATVSDSVPEPVNDTTLLPTAEVQSDTVPPTFGETTIPVTSTNPDTASQETTSPAASATAIDTTASDTSGSETSFVTGDLSATTTDVTLTETTSDFTSEVTQGVTSEETSEVTADVISTESGSATTTTIPTTTGTTSRARSTSTVIVVSSTFITSSINPSDTSSAYSYSDSVYSSISAEETWSSGYWVDENNEGGGAGGATVNSPPPAETSTSSSNGTDTSTLSPQQKQVIGGVVGSVAGVAFLAFFVLFALRYKKKHPGGGILGGNGTSTRSIGGPGTGPDGGSMAEHSGTSSVVAATLAGLMGKKQRQAPEPAANTERGFYRVSGKKLPSVLQVGGDGYSDPRDGPPSTGLSPSGPPPSGPPTSGRAVRESMMSGHSDYWRGSMAFDPADRDSHHLALGTPMRPISGVPVIRSGPARTPVTESNPFTDPRPRPDSDALGGSTGGASITSHESPSRFQERI
ncbi:hypothetical protein FGRMN_5090 [Fusarium graminum]|nr:hypothetical protein FGRMN_5090 [Fusarium graminum]